MTNQSPHSNLDLKFDVSTAYGETVRALEDALVGAVLVNPEILEEEDSIRSVKPSDFLIEINGWIWEAIHGLYIDGDPVDILTVSSSLEDQGRLIEVGGPAHLTALISRVPSSLNAPFYARKVREYSALRGVMNALSKSAKEIYKSEVASPGDYFKIPIGILQEKSLEYLGIEVERDIISAFDLEKWIPPTSEWLMRDALVSGGINLISGDPGSGKTWLILDAGIAVATGSPGWASLPTGDPAGVLYLGVDDRRRLIRDRLMRLSRGRGLPHSPENFFISQRVYDLTDDREMLGLQRLVEQYGIRLVIIDIWFRHANGLDLNDMGAVSELFGHLRRLSGRTGVGFLLTHYQRKSPGTRLLEAIGGSVGIPGGVDIAYEIKRKDSGRILEQSKTKDRDAIKPLKYNLVDLNDGNIILTWDRTMAYGEPRNRAEEVAFAWHEYMTANPGTYSSDDLRDLMGTAGIPNAGRNTFYDALDRLGMMNGIETTGGVGGIMKKFTIKGGCSQLASCSRIPPFSPPLSGG